MHFGAGLHRNEYDAKVWVFRQCRRASACAALKCFVLLLLLLYCCGEANLQAANSGNRTRVLLPSPSLQVILTVAMMFPPSEM
jgi:hypothetical protein